MSRQRTKRSTGIKREEFDALLKEKASAEKEFDYDADLEIDPHFLDAEWLDQSRRYMKYAEEAARANKAKALAEEKVKTLRSELVEKVTLDPDKYLGKGVKPNAPIVEAYYRLDEDYIEAKEAFVEASFYADLLTGAVFAFQMRKVALENLLRMQLSEYYSEPRTPNDLVDAVERFKELKQNSARSKIRKRLGH